MGLSPEQEEEQPVGPSPGHHSGSRGGEEEQQPVGQSLRHHRGSRGEEEEEQTSVSESGASPWQPGRKGGGANQWVRVRGRKRSNQWVQVLGITVEVEEERRRSNQ